VERKSIRAEHLEGTFWRREPQFESMAASQTISDENSLPVI
jgi:hypothetical protein